MYIPPPVLLLGAIALSYIASKAAPSLAVGTDPLYGPGILLIVLGFFLFVWTVSYFRRHRTTLHPRGKPRRLISAGPFRISRNPIYLGFLLVSVGFALVFANVLALVGPLLFFSFINSFVIPFEEDMLGKTFGRSYRSYRAKIRRWV